MIKLPMIPGIFNDPAEAEKKRLRDELIRRTLEGVGPVPLGGREVLTRNDAPIPLPALAAPPAVLARPTVDVGEPPPVLTRSLPDPLTAGITPIQPVLPSPSLEEIGAPPVMIRRNNKQRPLEAFGGQDSLESDQALLEAQKSYKAPRSTKDFLKRLALGFFSGGIPGAVGQGLGYQLNQDVRNQDAVGGNIADTQGRIQRTLVGRKFQNELLNDETERAYKLNQITRSGQPKETYGWIPNPADPEGADIYAPLRPGLIRTVRKPKATERPPLLRTRKNSDGSEVTLKSEDNGKTWTEIPDLISRPEPKFDSSEFTNEQLNRNIQEATTERDRIWASLKDVPPTIITPGQVYGDGTSDPPETKPNPAYTDLMKRGRELDDHIRTYRGQLKSSKTPPRSSQKTLDPTLEQAIRAAAKAKGLDPDKAVSKAKERM